ncbi:MAG: histidine phosphatase family protein [Anaerotignaceae bacterium]
MIRLYLIRHGETDWNKEGRFQGWTDIELSQEGTRQAELLGERFKNIHIDELYSSPLKRAVDTAKPIANATGLEIKTNEKFKEINFGTWEGMTAVEIAKEYGGAFEDFINKPETCTFPGDTSFELVTQRLKEGMAEILGDKDNMNIAIVSHGGIVRLLVKHLVEIEGAWFNKTWIDNTSISVVEIKKRGNLLRVLNDCSHLHII